jgi:serine/threonine protein kinase
MILTILPVAGLHCMPKVIRGSHGNLCSVHLVELRGTGEVFAMKAMDKSVMLNRNKVHRARAEREILALLDHPFLPTLYASFQVLKIFFFISVHVYLFTSVFIQSMS